MLELKELAERQQINTGKTTDITLGEKTDSIIKNPNYTQEAIKLINQYGGKAASIIWQYNKGNGIYLLPFSIIDDFQNFKASNIEYIEFFRSSGIGDQNGLVGILESIKKDKGENTKSIVDELVTKGQSQEVLSYASNFDGNINYRGVSSIIVSPHLDIIGKYVLGSIVKHPDFLDLYIINFDGGRSQCIVDKNGDIIKTIGFINKIKELTKYINSILEMKKKTDDNGFIIGKTTQTEFAIILSDSGYEKAKKISGYDFNSNLNGNIVFLQQREFRNETKTKYPYKDLEESYFNRFGNQDVFSKGYPKVNVIETLEYLQNNKKSEYNKKIIIVIDENNYIKIKNIKWSEIIKNPRVAGILIKPGQSQGLGSLEHETYRILNNTLPIKVSHI